MSDGRANPDVEVALSLAEAASLPPEVRVIARFGDVVTARVPAGLMPRLAEAAGVVRLETAQSFACEPECCGDGEVEGMAGPRPSTSYSGKGTVAAFLDWGCDFAHEAFLAEDGSTRLLALWDQKAEYDPRHPNKYGFGRVYEAAEIDAALRQADPYAALGYHPASGDPDGVGAHGTHVMDIAAGSPRSRSEGGIAPDAHLLFVHLAPSRTDGLGNLGDSVRLLEALDFVREQARTRPFAANLSLGRCGGPHDGTTLVEKGIDVLVSEATGRAVVMSTGNYFDANIHASGRLPPNRVHELHWTTHEGDATDNELEIWYARDDRFRVALVPPRTEEGFVAELGTQMPVELDGRVVGRMHHRPEVAGNRENHVDIFLSPEAPAGTWTVRIEAVDVVDGRYDAWIERDTGSDASQSRFEEHTADPRSTIGSIVNGRLSIACGALDIRGDRPRLAPFSSSGPTRTGLAKPDIVAPGVALVAARSTPSGHTVGVESTIKSGTSMAAPAVTGAICQVFEAAPRPLSIRETRTVVLGSAEPLGDLQDEAERIGAGLLDVEAAVEAVLALDEGRRRPRAEASPWVAESIAETSVVDAATREEEATAPFTCRIAEALAAGGGGRRDHDVLLSECFGVNRRGRPAVKVVARPGERVSGLRAGDVVVQRPFGERHAASTSAVVDPELLTAGAARANGLRPFGRSHGYFVRVLEGGVRPKGPAARAARAIADEHGRLLADCVVVRAPAEQTRAPSPAVESLAGLIARAGIQSRSWRVTDPRAVLRSAPSAGGAGLQVLRPAQVLPHGALVAVEATHVRNGVVFARVRASGPDASSGWTAVANLDANMAIVSFTPEPNLVGETLMVTDADAIVRDASLAPVQPRQTLPRGIQVVVREQAHRNHHDYVRVQPIGDAGGPAVWTARGNLQGQAAHERSDHAMWQRGRYLGETGLIDAVGTGGRLVRGVTATYDHLWAMREAASADGVTLTLNSGFRTYAHQARLRAAYLAKTGNLAAAPGRSNHQSGLAYDLETAMRGVSLRRPERWSDSYRWLVLNAWRHGFIRAVASETWHWEHRPDVASASSDSYGTRSTLLRHMAANPAWRPYPGYGSPGATPPG